MARAIATQHRRRDRFWPAMLVSAAVHAAILAAGLASHRRSLVEGSKFVSVALVRLGDEADPGALRNAPSMPSPDADRSEPFPAAARVKPPHEPGRSADVPSDRSVKPGHPAGNSLARTIPSPGEVVREGHWVRVPGGMVYEDPNGTSARDYVALVTAVLQSACVLPDAQSEPSSLATILLRVESGGRIAGWSFDTRSGSAVFDAAIERAIRSSQLPPPPPELCERYRTEGIRLTLRM